MLGLALLPAAARASQDAVVVVGRADPEEDPREATPFARHVYLDESAAPVTDVGELLTDSTGVRVRRTGEELGSIPVDGVVHGMTVQGGRLLVGLRRAQDRNAGVRGVLQAIDIESRAVLWEFKAQSVALGAFGVDDLAVAFVDAEDEVVVFR